MTETLDPFLHPVRDDLAGAELKGRVERPRFAEGRPARVAVGTLDLRRAPARDAPLDTQLFHGDRVRVYETGNGWAWLQNAADGYVGYAEAAALRDEVETPTHWVRVPRTFVFPTPEEKAPPLDALPMTAKVRVLSERGRYSEVARGPGSGWVPSGHLAVVGETVEDFVSTALAFIGVPYLLGGRTSLGLDCSGLIQVALNAAGIACLRDSYMQEASLGEARPLDAPASRGDLYYMPGHVAIALDRWRVVHTNAHDMLTSIEPLEDLVARVQAASGKGITAIRRPRPLV
ncbi:MAG: NlpC/P60 family protein [Kiloniellales bacterium]|nr:NlpC/P60 family protein [Kiloniellales bacterium]